MKSRHLISLLCFFVLLCLACCKHEPPPPVCQYDSSVEEMKKWYYFKAGTWWVYQEQNTGVLDTITVYYDWEGLSQSGYDGFEWYGNSSLDGFNYYYTFNSSFSIYCLSQQECTCHKVDRAKGQAGNFVGSGKILLYPLILGNYTNDHGGTCSIVSIFDSLVFQNNVFYEVAKFKIEVDASENYSSTEYLIAKNQGIVEMTNNQSNQNWKLIQSVIIQ
jgi:hypothetical protein